MFGNFIKYTVAAMVSLVWFCLVCLLLSAAVPGVVFYADVWTGWFWTSGIAGVILLSMGLGALRVAMEN